MSPKSKAKSTVKSPAKSKVPPKKPAPSGTVSSIGDRIRVRMYRQGLGDCFLVSLPRPGGQPFYLMIDCGVILGTPDPGPMMQKVVQDIIDTTGGHVDVLAVTHEHWDHVSGFLQAKDLFTSKLKFDEVWLAWTEDPKDDLANQLRSQHQALRVALAGAAVRMGVAGNLSAAQEVTSMLEFFGAAGSGTTTDALDVVKGLSKNIRFCRPTDPPIDLEDGKVRVYVLGPPHDIKMIKKVNPSSAHPETYGLAAAEQFLGAVGPALSESDPGAPFDRSYQVPYPAAQQMSFFQSHYWGEQIGGTEKDQSWRRIDGAWLDSATTLALQLDSATNNTSLALALELVDTGDIIIFAADAQVGNWLSWQDLSWNIDGKKTTGPDVLSRTRIYKAGHHGSHNATLNEKGLEMMTGLEIVLIPVDHAMALKKRWGNMPLPQLIDRMTELTKGRILRIDQPAPPELKDRTRERPLYYEVGL